MRAVITVVGKDTVGILSGVSEVCAHNGINIIEVSQSILQELFCMIMLVDMEGATVTFSDFSDELKAMGREKNLQIHAMHEDVFNTMHHV
ncbi:MAG: ACT domain-containing protein [Clostridia bacterium]|jgi:ACT domain-containing protein|nr:ACT domain-containing protein [Clostridia bacterium]MBQ4245086.1 ACT domain-containing protein [Clostridia bacterium]